MTSRQFTGVFMATNDTEVAEEKQPLISKSCILKRSGVELMLCSEKRPFSFHLEILGH